MELQKLNKRLNAIYLNLRADKTTSHDTGQVYYDTWLEYWNHSRNKWSIEHVLGCYATERDAIKVCLDWLTLNHIKY